MARPTDLGTFVFAKLPLQAQEQHLEHVDLPTLPDVPANGAGNLLAELAEHADNASPNVPEHVNLPEFLDLL